MTDPVEPATREEWETALRQKASSDPGFVGWLMTAPHRALEEAFGRTPPSGVEVKAVAETPERLVVVRRPPKVPVEATAGLDPHARLIAALHEVAERIPRFWEELRRDARRTLAEHLGLELPGHVEVDVLEESPTQAYVVLPHNDHLRDWEPPSGTPA